MSDKFLELKRSYERGTYRQQQVAERRAKLDGFLRVAFKWLFPDLGPKTPQERFRDIMDRYGVTGNMRLEYLSLLNKDIVLDAAEFGAWCSQYNENYVQYLDVKTGELYRWVYGVKTTEITGRIVLKNTVQDMLDEADRAEKLFNELDKSFKDLGSATIR